jgi:hypothetical protein
MSARDRTSIELPKALSGSNELMAWSGVESTRMVPGWDDALLGFTWADAVPICAANEKIQMAASSRRVDLRLTILSFIALNAVAIVLP